MKARTSLLGAAAAVAGLAVVLTGCSSSSGGGSTSSASGISVPASIKSAGKLTIGMSFPYAPFQYYEKDNKTQTGIEVDLANAIAKKMGVTASISNVSFDGILPGVNGARYDLAMSGLGVTKERTAAVDFVTDFATGYSMAVPKTLASSVTTITDLCGHTVSAGSGTTSVLQVQAQSTKCVAAGKKAITMVQFKNQAEQDLAVTTGRAQIDMLTYAAAQAFAQKETSFTVPKPYATVDFGIGIKKGSTQLEKAVKDAMNSVIKDGSYAKILKKYGQTNGAISASKIVTTISTN